VIYRSDLEAIVIASVFAKRTRKTPRREIENARRRLLRYDARTRVYAEDEEVP
jgi:phage-related protein